MRPNTGKWTRNVPKTPAERPTRRQYGHVSTSNHGQRSFVQTFLRLVIGVGQIACIDRTQRGALRPWQRLLVLGRLRQLLNGAQCVHLHRFEILQHICRVIAYWISFDNYRRAYQGARQDDAR